MKKITPYLLFVLFVVLLASCGKKKDEVTPAIVGKWQWVQDMTLKTLAGATNDTIMHTYSSTDIYYQFKGDGTYAGRFSDDSAAPIETGTYALSGNQLTLTTQSATRTTHNYFVYSLNGVDLIFTQNKDELLKALNEQVKTNPLAQNDILSLNMYDTVTYTLTMRKM